MNNETAGRVGSPRVAVIVLTLDACEMTLRCLGSLITQEGADFRVLLWDNGSSDGTAEAVRRAYPDVLVHRHPSNLGVASGRNAAAELAMRELDPTHLLFLDNDMVLEPGFIRGLMAPFADEDRVGQTQAKLRFADDPQRLNDGGGCEITFWLARTRPVGYRELDRGQRDRREPCVSCGGAMMVRADLFWELGGFDAAFDPFGPEDLDFSLRLQEAGYRALYAPEAVAYHEVSHTFGAGYTEQYARHKARHWLRFLRRHAPLSQRLGFYLLGAPLLVSRMLVRELARGNPGALRGAARGLADALRRS